MADLEEPEDTGVIPQAAVTAAPPAPGKGVPHAKSRPRPTAPVAPEPDLVIERIQESAEDDEDEKMRARERAEHKKRTSTEAAMTIVLSTEALEVPKLAATAISPKYSAAAGKPVRESKLAATLIKVAAVLCIVAGVGYALTKKNSNGIKTPWERLMERKEVLTAEDHSMGEQAPAQQQPEAAAPMPTTTRATITTTATTTAPAPTTAPNDDSSGLDPQVEASLLEKCGGDVEFCYRNGVAFVDDKKYKTAAHFFEATCKINYGPGCAGMAQLFANGNGVEQSYAKAMEFYQKSCDIGFGSACLSLGFGFAKGITGAASPEKALEAFQKACDKDLAEACTQAGYAYVKGEGVGRAPARAAQLFGKACRMNDSVACDEAKKVETNK